MFAFVENGVLVQFPFTERDLAKKYPNTSFGSGMTDAQKAEFGMMRVFNSTQPSVTSTQTFEQGTPVYSNEEQRWVQVWVVRDKTSEELAEDAQSVRAERNDKLAQSDWTQVADAPVDKAAWATYRQALRDITTQDGFPWTVTWPDQP